MDVCANFKENTSRWSWDILFKRIRQKKKNAMAVGSAEA